MLSSERNGVLSPRVVGWVTPLLLILGVQCWLLIDPRLVRTPFELLFLGAVIVVAVVPPIQRRIAQLLDWFASRRGISVAIIALLIWAASSTYFWAEAVRQGRPFVPIYHDEFSYLIQAQMLARGRLWMPMHPLADFFDSFYVIVEPVYSSMYFPGTAMLLTPGVWLGLPSWVMPLLLGGATVAMAYLVLRELIDGVAGVLAAVMLLGNWMMRMLGIMRLSAMPALLLGLIVMWAWLRWRQHRTTWWLVACGAASGWLAITRPVDALCFALPVWGAILLHRGRLRAAAILCAAAMPLLAVQLAFNRGVTGHWFTTPFTHYTDRDYPNASFGFHKFDPAARPASVIAQKQQFYNETVLPLIRSHRPANVARDWPRRLRVMLNENLPEPLLAILLPAGVLGLNRRRYWPVLLTVPLFMLLYSGYAFFIVHYLIIAAPAVVLLVLLGTKTIERSWPRAAGPFRTLCSGFIVAATAISLPVFHRTASDTVLEGSLHPRVNAALSQLQHTPAVVLFKYSPGQSLEEEPVYNAGVAWPDDAAVIRAHDLGERNVEIFRYYAQRQPQRAFYLYDRGDDSLRFLGWAQELAQ